jgi:hypothetical protein
MTGWTVSVSSGQERLDALLVAGLEAPGEEEEALPLSLLSLDPDPLGVESAPFEQTFARGSNRVFGSHRGGILPGHLDILPFHKIHLRS